MKILLRDRQGGGSLFLDMANDTNTYWDVLVKENGEWISVFGPFEEWCDAKGVVDEIFEKNDNVEVWLKSVKVKR
jgi:hypothetical protein